VLNANEQANAITMVGDVEWAHEFPQCHYVTIVLICQVDMKSPAIIHQYSYVN
jgi:hypothetical protein